MTFTNSFGTWHTNGSPNPGQKTRPYCNQQQQQQHKRICKIVDFAVPADHRIKLNEIEKKDKYIDLARELKKKQTMEHEGDNYTNWDWYILYSNWRTIKGTKGLGR